MGYDMEMEEYHEDIEMKNKHKKELERLAKEMSEEAKKVREDYKKNPSEMSGSVVQIHEDSPFLDELLKGDSWKTIIKNIPTVPSTLEEELKTNIFLRCDQNTIKLNLNITF